MTGSENGLNIYLSMAKLNSSAKKSFLVILVIFISAIVIAGAYYLATNQFLFRPHASNATQSATGVLLKRGTTAFAPCAPHVTTPYAMAGGVATQFGNNSGCLPIIANASLADPFVGKRVTISGVYQITGVPTSQPTIGPAQTGSKGSESIVGGSNNKLTPANQANGGGIFYATTIVDASNVVPLPGPNQPKITPKPVPTAIPCVGLHSGAACDPKATSPTQKCCAPDSCTGVWNGKTGQTTNYTCFYGVRAL